MWKHVALQSKFVFNVLQRVKHESQQVNPDLPQLSENIYVFILTVENVGP